MWIWASAFIIGSFAIYLLIGRQFGAGDVKGFYAAGSVSSPIKTGMAIATDWISAATFISMAGYISVTGFSGSVYIMGWTGGYVLLALILAPYLRKFGKFTVPDFVNTRYYSSLAGVIALFAAIIISLVYFCGQLRGVGIVLARIFEIPVAWAIVGGALLTLFYSFLGGINPGSRTKAGQYIIVIVAYLAPAGVIAYKLTGMPIPQLALGFDGSTEGSFLKLLDHLGGDAGLAPFVSSESLNYQNPLNLLCITVALMVGTAGLPHIVSKFYSIPSASAARMSAAYALLFIALLYTAAPSLAGFARYGVLEQIQSKEYSEAPKWFNKWEKTGLVNWDDKSKPGAVSFRYINKIPNLESTTADTVVIDPDILVLATPETVSLPPWITALLLLGAITAALTTSAGLLLVIGSTFSHDFYYRLINKSAIERKQAAIGRFAMIIATMAAAGFSMYPPGSIVQVVAYAFGLAAATFFPVLALGVFWKRATSQGAIAGMALGLVFTGSYIIQVAIFKDEPWFFGISPEGIGAIGMLINFATTILVSRFTPPPPMDVQDFVENIRVPKVSDQAFGWNNRR